MAHSLPTIYFYFPYPDFIADKLPQSIETSWYWQVNEGRYKYDIPDGEYAWILQTYLRLKAANFPCQLTETIPTTGILLAYREQLPFNVKPGQNLLLICLLGDKAPHPYAHLSVVQNSQALFTEYALVGNIHEPKAISTQLQPFADKYYIPHWPQPGLIPRSRARGERFEKIAFFGVGAFLAPELRDRSWQKQVEALGLHWHFKGRDQVTDGWTNYSDVDVILAVRSFEKGNDYSWKPATKLYNAWHAGVPAILGRESAFQAERKSELDYLEVTSIEETIAALQRLRDDKHLRLEMVENGLIRAQETLPDKITAKWCEFLIKTAVPAYERWRTASSWSQQAFLQRRYLAVQTHSFQRYFELKMNSMQRYFEGSGVQE